MGKHLSDFVARKVFLCTIFLEGNTEGENDKSENIKMKPWISRGWTPAVVLPPSQLGFVSRKETQQCCHTLSLCNLPQNSSPELNLKKKKTNPK